MNFDMTGITTAPSTTTLNFVNGTTFPTVETQDGMTDYETTTEISSKYKSMVRNYSV